MVDRVDYRSDQTQFGGQECKQKPYPEPLYSLEAEIYGWDGVVEVLCHEGEGELPWNELKVGMDLRFNDRIYRVERVVPMETMPNLVLVSRLQ